MHRTALQMAFNILVLGEKDVRKCLSMKDCLEINRKAFLSLTTPNAVVPSRLALPYPNPSTPEDWTLFKPAALYCDATADATETTATGMPTTAATTMGMKLVSVRANNPPQHPLVPATIMMIHPETGMVEGLMSATYLTGARTATGPALASFLCRPDAHHVVLFGAGLQAETHMDALACTLPCLTHLTIVNRSRPRAEQLVQTVTSRDSKTLQGLVTSIVLLSDTPAVHAALSQADVICATTNSLVPLFEHNGHVKPGCHINSIGSYTPDMSEIPPGLVSCSTVLVDTIDALTVGDLKHLPPDHPHCLLGHALQHPTWLADNKMEYTFFKGVGTAIQDVMTGAMVLERAKELGLGTQLDMT
jgi:ornithine cyclodeaminase